MRLTFEFEVERSMQDEARRQFDSLHPHPWPKRREKGLLIAFGPAKFVLLPFDSAHVCYFSLRLSIQLPIESSHCQLGEDTRTSFKCCRVRNKKNKIKKFYFLFSVCLSLISCI